MPRAHNGYKWARRRISSTLLAFSRTHGLPGECVLVAVSGGIDSTVLFHALDHIRTVPRIELVIGHVHHGLRGAESDEDEKFVRDLGQKFGVGVYVERVAPEARRVGIASRDRPTIQEAARGLRYDALHRIADRCNAVKIVTAHTADDQMETVFLRLLRGAGPDSLSGIPELSFDGRVLRPLLGISRGEIEQYAEGEGLIWREDRSNSDRRYARNRLRHDWLPGLAAAFNPKLLSAVGNFANAQRQDAVWIAEHVAREAEKRITSRESGFRIDTHGWNQLPKALSVRLARVILQRTGRARDITRSHLWRIDSFMSGGRIGAVIELPGGWRLESRRGEVDLLPAGVRPGDEC